MASRSPACSSTESWNTEEEAQERAVRARAHARAARRKSDRTGMILPYSFTPKMPRLVARRGPMRRLASIAIARKPLWIAAILLFVAVLAPPARANLGAEGEPTFGISGWFKNPPRLNEEATLLVRIWGGDASDHPVISAARISIPEGIEVV